MKNFRQGHRHKGITLTELMVSILILTIVWLAAVDALIVSRYSLSYSKHKTQAVYVAQRIIEEGRRWSFADLDAGFRTTHTGQVAIDTKGTFTNTADDFMGNSVVTVTALDSYRNRVRVEINWNEVVFGANKTIREYCTADLTNEDVLR